MLTTIADIHRRFPALSEGGEANARGNMVTRDFIPTGMGFTYGDRYGFDNNLTDAWQQFDTSQDASYFGVWVAPSQLATLTFGEGDITLVVCPDREHYNAEVRDAIEFYAEGCIAKGWSPGEGWTVCRQDRNEFLIPRRHKNEPLQEHDHPHRERRTGS